MSAEEYGIENGWLVEYVDYHTCGTAPGGHFGLHEPGCGTEPVMPMVDVIKQLGLSDESTTTQADGAS